MMGCVLILIASMPPEHSTQITAREIYAEKKRGVVLTVTEAKEGEIAVDFLVNGYSPEQVVGLIDDVRQALIDNAGDTRHLKK